MLRNDSLPEKLKKEVTPEDQQAKQRWYLEAATAESTRRSYRSAVRHFERWGMIVSAL